MNDLASEIRRRREASAKASAEASRAHAALVEIRDKVGAWSADPSLMAAAVLAEVGIIAAAGLAGDKLVREGGP